MKNYLNNNFDFKEFVEVFDETPIWSAPFGLKLLDFIHYKTNISALDIGFGAGFPLTEIALRLGESSVVYGIDPWKEAIERANKKIAYYGLNNVRIMEGVAESIPLESGSIDLITSNNGLNNVDDIDKALSECARILRKGGQFVQTMNTDLSMFEFYNELEHVLSEMKLDEEIKNMHLHISHKRPPIDGYISKMRSQGFVVKDLEHDQFNYRFANGTALLNHYFIRIAFMDSWIKLVPAEHLEQVFDLIGSRLNEQSQKWVG